MAENAFGRAAAWLRRVRAAPALVDQVASIQRDQVRDVHAVGAQVAELAERLESLFAELGASMSEQVGLAQITTVGLARDAAMQELLAGLGDERPLKPGLSTVTISWNHAGFLPDAVASALATLDLLPPAEQGDVLVLDNGSSDETAQVLEDLTAADPRVRPVRSPMNLGLTRARNVLLHVAQTEHALMLDADNTAVPPGIGALYAVGREWEAAFTYGNVIMSRPDGSSLTVASNEPPTREYFFGGGPHIDSLGVLDVAYFRRVGGYSAEPVFQAFDDHEIIHRLARHGALIAFVPTVAGRYRIDDLSHSQLRTHRSLHAAANARLRRAYDQDGRLTDREPATMAAHPATGALWATPAARRARPALAIIDETLSPSP